MSAFVTCIRLCICAGNLPPSRVSELFVRSSPGNTVDIDNVLY